jgi:hypothetical protein
MTPEQRHAMERNRLRAERQLDAVMISIDKHYTDARRVWQFAAMAVWHGNRIDRLNQQLGEPTQ